jgi:hypothetical protein
MSGAGALVELEVVLVSAFEFFDDSSLVFELEFDDVTVVVDLQPSAMPASNASASTLRCRDRIFIFCSNPVD